MLVSTHWYCTHIIGAHDGMMGEKRQKNCFIAPTATSVCLFVCLYFNRAKTTLHFCAGATTRECFYSWITPISDHIFAICYGMWGSFGALAAVLLDVNGGIVEKISLQKKSIENDSKTYQYF